MTNLPPTLWPSSSSHQSAFGYALMSPRPKRPERSDRCPTRRQQWFGFSSFGVLFLALPAFSGADRARGVALDTEVDLCRVLNTDQGERPMAWTTPTLVEVCVGLEINGYLPAEF